MKCKGSLELGPLEEWECGSKAQELRLLQNNWNEQQGSAAGDGGLEPVPAERDRCGWEDHAEHIDCVTVELVGDVETADVAGVDGGRLMHVAELDAELAVAQLAVAGSGAVGVAAQIAE